jgi:hypothetical protein
MTFIIRQPTPILNTPHFHKVFGESLPFDEKKLVRELEMIALPEMVFEVVHQEEKGIFQVRSDDYPSFPLYLDGRAGEFSSKKRSREKRLPEMELILERMRAKVGVSYVWGGNYSLGISEWLKWYPPQKKLTPFEEIHWTFRGVDCSGLLYEATDGFTPRNTSELMTFGEEISLRDVKPLDMILYPGHLIIALNKEEVIESNHDKGGVIISSMERRLSEIKKPFIIRRFHPDAFQIL